MSETETLNALADRLSLDSWWEDLIGQKADFANFRDDLAVERLPRTEIKAAREIKNKFGDTLTYIEATHTWYIWDGKIHTPCESDGVVIKIVKKYYDAVDKALQFISEVLTAQSRIHKDMTGESDETGEGKGLAEKYDKLFMKHRKFRDRISADAGQVAIVNMLRTECDIPADHYLNDQRWFVTRNWVLDLDALRATGQLVWLEHVPSMPITRMFDADYLGAEANLGHWDTYLQKSVPHEEQREYLQKVVGAAFMGTAKTRCIINVIGPPGSGKSLLLDTLNKLGKVGAWYGQAPDSKAVIKMPGATNFEQDKMRGARVVSVSEPPASDNIDDDFIKKYSGDEWVETRTLHSKGGGWIPQGILFIASNKRLKLNTRDKAVVERVQMIEFPNEFRKNSADPMYELIPGLEHLLMEDRSRVLTWILRGMLKFHKDGLTLDPPDSVKALQTDIVVDGSAALRWVDDWVERGFIEINHDVDPKYLLKADDAYLHYQIWSGQNGERHPLTKRFFLEDIGTKYGERTVVFNTVYLSGLKVTESYRAKFQSAVSDAAGFNNEKKGGLGF